jgi:hypothetical protein
VSFDVACTALRGLVALHTILIFVTSLIRRIQLVLKNQEAMRLHAIEHHQRRAIGRFECEFQRRFVFLMYQRSASATQHMLAKYCGQAHESFITCGTRTCIVERWWK